jgi:hypothetical protein
MKQVSKIKLMGITHTQLLRTRISVCYSRSVSYELELIEVSVAPCLGSLRNRANPRCTICESTLVDLHMFRTLRVLIKRRYSCRDSLRQLRLPSLYIMFRAWINWGYGRSTSYELEIMEVTQLSAGNSGLRHEMSSLARTLGSWVWITIKAWLSACVYSVCIRSLATGRSLVQGVLPTV